MYSDIDVWSDTSILPVWLKEEGYPMAGKGKTRKIYRDARTGKYVTKRYAEMHPGTTVRETVKVPRKGKK